MDFAIHCIPQKEKMERLLDLSFCRSYREEKRICVSYWEGNGVFPYTAFIETVDKNGNKSAEKITIKDPGQHFLKIASTNIFLNNICLKKIDGDKNDPDRIYTIRRIIMRGGFFFFSQSWDNHNPEELLKMIESGDMCDCYDWYSFINVLEKRTWNNIFFELREVFDFSDDGRLIDTVTFDRLINDYKIHKIIKSKLNSNKPLIKTQSW